MVQYHVNRPSPKVCGGGGMCRREVTQQSGDSYIVARKSPRASEWPSDRPTPVEALAGCPAVHTEAYGRGLSHEAGGNL